MSDDQFSKTRASAGYQQGEGWFIFRERNVPGASDGFSHLGGKLIRLKIDSQFGPGAGLQSQLFPGHQDVAGRFLFGGLPQDRQVTMGDMHMKDMIFLAALKAH